MRFNWMVDKCKVVSWMVSFVATYPLEHRLSIVKVYSSEEVGVSVPLGGLGPCLRNGIPRRTEFPKLQNK